MGVLTKERDTVEVANGARTLVLPVKASTIIFQGAMVAVDASGYAVPAKKAAGLKAAGRAEETMDNRSGADGDVKIRVRRGVFVWDNSATAASQVGEGDVLGVCYMEDDHTVTKTASGSSVAGTVIRVTADGVAVEVDPARAAAAAAETAK